MENDSINVESEAPWTAEADGKQISPRRTLIGTPPDNHWLHNDKTGTFDLTRPAEPKFTQPKSGEAITLKTTTSPVIISPKKTALVIIDMQNFFLSTALGRSADGAGNQARRRLLEYALPAARTAGLQVIWLNWGLTQADIDAMPSSTLRAFGFNSTQSNKHAGNNVTELNKPRRLYRGLGSDMGPVKLRDGTTVDAGRLLFRDSWNADLPRDLKEDFQKGLQAKRPDVWIHKNRMSGLWGAFTPCTEYLERQGVRTLIFAGVNTDQCVAGSLQDAYSKGYDCILLKDGCGTTSPEYASHCVEYNTARSWGFVTDCTHFKAGIDEYIEEGRAGHGPYPSQTYDSLERV